MLSVVIAVLAILCPNTGVARNSLRFETLADIQSQAITFLQDSDGFFWVGTLADGVYRFDGTRLEHHTRTSRLVLGNNVPCMLEDRSGALWFAASGGGVTRYDKSTNRVTAIAPDGPEGLGRAAVHWTGKQACVEDSDGYIWLGTIGDGLKRIDPKTLEIRHYRAGDGGGLPDDGIRAVYEDRSGTLWVGTEGGLVGLDRDRVRFSPLAPADGDLKGLGDAIITALREDRGGDLWIGTENRGLGRVDATRRRLTRYRYDADDASTVGSTRAIDIFETTAGELWFSHENHISVFHPEGGTFSRHAVDVTKSLVDPRTGAQWALFDSGRIGRLKTEPARFRVRLHDPADQHSLSSSVVVTVFEDSRGDIWVATLGGLNRLERETGRFTRYMHDPKDPGTVPSTIDYSPGLYEDAQGRFWVGSAMPAAISEMDAPSGRVIRSFLPDPADPEALPDVTQINMFLEDPDTPNVFWVASAGGLVRFDESNGEFRHLSRADTWAVRMDERGVLWLATWGNGLGRYDRTTGELRYLKHIPTDPTSLSANVATAIHRAADGRWWVGTEHGLCRFDPVAERFERFTPDEGYPWEAIHSIGEDATGVLWLGTNVGLGRFDPETRASRLYTKADGFEASMFYALNGIRTSDGQMWFGGTGGLVTFFPERIRDNPHRPPVVLTAVKQAGVDVDFGAAPERLAEITLDWQHNFFEFEFAALDYANPTQNRYAYMLEGLDVGWYQAGEHNFGRYTGIPPGTYVLRLRGSNNDGLWNEEGQTVTVRVLPPFWQTVWFRALLALGALALLAGVAFHVVRLRREIRERVRAEAELRTSRDHLEHLNEELGRLDRLKDEFLANMSHELRTPLNGIIGLAEAMLDTLSSSLPARAAVDLRMIVSSGRRLASLVNDILDFSKLRHQDLELRTRPLDPRSAVQVVLDLSRPLVGKKSITLSNRIAPDGPLVLADEDRLQQVLHNLVGNAIKFTEAGEIAVEAESRGDSLAITVRDSGVGIPADRLSGIFQPFEQADGSTARRFGGTGLGLSISRHLIELHGGDISAESKVGEGSAFTFTLPVTEERDDVTARTITQALDPAAAAPDGALVDEPRVPGCGARVLVVDDEPVNQRVLESQLALRDYDVTVASSGQEALAALDADGPFDLVLLDVMMPGMTGYEVCARVRERYAPDELPVVMVTANNRVEDLVVGLEAGANDYLPKPVPKRELLARVETHLLVKELSQARLAGERAFRELEEKLAQAEKMGAVGTLAAGIAHDFNNLLQIIAGHAELVLIEQAATADGAEALKTIEKAANRGAELVRGLLAFSRADEPKRRPLDLNDVVTETVELLRRTISPMVEIRMALAPRLPHIRGDARQLQQVVMNLGTNARDAMDVGGTLRLATATTTVTPSQSAERLELPAGDYVRLTVSDNGCGMPPEVVAHAFEPFFTTKDVGQGTGLGLATTYGIVRSHEGAIDCDSAPGQGTTMTLYFPAVQAPGAGAAAPAPRDVGPDAGRGERVLVVDDDPHVAHVAVRALAARGYVVESVESGEDALARIDDGEAPPVALVLLDLGMPGMGGRRCLRELLERDPDRKVIVATGYAVPSGPESPLSQGARDLIQKPFHIKDLAARVRAVLDG